MSEIKIKKIKVSGVVHPLADEALEQVVQENSEVTAAALVEHESEINSIDEITAAALSDLHQNKQDALVSGTNIKTINNQSLLGSGDITINSGISGTGVTSIVALTESEYAALVTKDSTTLYIVKPDPDYGDNYVKISNATGNGTVLEVGENLNMSQNPTLYGPNYEILSTTSGSWDWEAGRYWYYFPETAWSDPQYIFDDSSPQYKPYVGLGYSYNNGSN